VQLIDGCGNITYSTLTIEICQLEFFNVFTPNNDGDNDYFNILGLQGYPNSQLIVYDRWGALVYSNLNYLGAWRGLNNKGKPLADGTYYFTLTVGHTDDEELEYLGEVVTDLSVDGIVKFSGSVTIFR
jgi:gliding motility-associated-like protein